MLRKAHLDTNGYWNGAGVQRPTHPGTDWSWGIQQTFLFHFFYIAPSGFRTSRFNVRAGGLVHSKDPINHDAGQFENVLRQRQFDSRVCWDLLEHFHPIEPYLTLLPDSMQHALNMHTETANAESQHLLTFPSCCDLSKGPHGLESCWNVHLTFDSCCLLRPP